MKKVIILRSVLGVFAACTCLSAVWYFVNLSEQNRLKASIQSLQSQEMASSLSLVRLQAAIHKTNVHPVTAQVVPEEPDEPGILDTLQSIAQESRASIQSIGLTAVDGTASGAVNSSSTIPSNAASAPQLSGNFVPVTLSVNGDDTHLLKFLQGLQNSPRKLVVLNVSYVLGKALTVNGLCLQLGFPYQ